jgi:hypothetical protein
MRRAGDNVASPVANDNSSLAWRHRGAALFALPFDASGDLTGTGLVA